MQRLRQHRRREPEIFTHEIFYPLLYFFILLPKTSLLNVYLSALELKLMENQTGSDILYYNDDDLTLVAPLLDQLISTRSGVASDHQCVHSLTFTNPPLHRDVTHAPRSSPTDAHYISHNVIRKTSLLTLFEFIADHSLNGWSLSPVLLANLNCLNQLNHLTFDGNLFDGDMLF